MRYLFYGIVALAVLSGAGVFVAGLDIPRWLASKLQGNSDVRSEDIYTKNLREKDALGLELEANDRKLRQEMEQAVMLLSQARRQVRDFYAGTELDPAFKSEMDQLDTLWSDMMLSWGISRDVSESLDSGSVLDSIEKAQERLRNLGGGKTGEEALAALDHSLDAARKLINERRFLKERLSAKQSQLRSDARVLSENMKEQQQQFRENVAKSDDRNAAADQRRREQMERVRDQQQVLRERMEALRQRSVR